MDIFIEGAMRFADTLNLGSVLGKRVLGKSGEVIGRVREVRFDPQKRVVEGVVVKRRPIVGSKLYISHEYITRITQDAVLLEMDPATLARGRKVVSADGKKFGTVKTIQRIDQSNDVEAYVVRRRLVWTYRIPASEFSKVGSSLILKKTYEKAREELTK